MRKLNNKILSDMTMKIGYDENIEGNSWGSV